MGEALGPRDYFGAAYRSGGAADITEFTFTGVGDKFRGIGGQHLSHSIFEDYDVSSRTISFCGSRDNRKVVHGRGCNRPRTSRPMQTKTKSHA